MSISMLFVSILINNYLFVISIYLYVISNYPH